MAVPVFGPIPLDEIAGTEPAAAPRRSSRAARRSASASASARPASAEPVKALIITGDNVAAHAWKETTKALKDLLEEGGRIKVDVTATPVEGPDRREPGQVRRAHPELQGYGRRPARVAMVGRQQGGVPQGGARRQGAGRLPLRARAPSPSRTGTSSRRRSPAAGGRRASTARRTSSPSRRPTSSTRSPRGCPPSSSTRSTSCTRTRC